MSGAPKWSTLIRKANAAAAAGLRVSLTATVIAYDPTSQTAVVQPVTAQPGGDQWPPLQDVPVVWPRTAAGGLFAPLAAGDAVLLVFADWSEDDFYTAGRTGNEPTTRRHSESDARAFPGPRIFTGPMVPVSPTGVGIQTDAGGAYLNLEPATQAATVEGTTIKLGATASDPVALASLVSAQLDLIASAISALGGTYTIAGPVAASKTLAE